MVLEMSGAEGTLGVTDLVPIIPQSNLSKSDWLGDNPRGAKNPVLM